MSERAKKALEIVATSNLAKKGDVWLVPSQSTRGHYIVASDLKLPARKIAPSLKQVRCMKLKALAVGRRNIILYDRIHLGLASMPAPITYYYPHDCVNRLLRVIQA